MIRCLIVDDSATFRRVLRSILVDGGDIEVVGEAADAAAAVTLARSLRPDVITMDVRMPGKSGIDAIRDIMLVSPTHVLVVASGASEEHLGISFQALQAGALDVLEKPRANAPFQLDEQGEAIRRAVRTVAATPRQRLPPPTPDPRAAEDAEALE